MRTRWLSSSEEIDVEVCAGVPRRPVDVCSAVDEKGVSGDEHRVVRRQEEGGAADLPLRALADAVAGWGVVMRRLPGPERPLRAGSSGDRAQDLAGRRRVGAGADDVAAD